MGERGPQSSPNRVLMIAGQQHSDRHKPTEDINQCISPAANTQLNQLSRTHLIPKHSFHRFYSLYIAQQSCSSSDCAISSNHFGTIEMHLQTIIILPCLVASVSATNSHNLKGSFSSFRAENIKPDNNTIANLYDGCSEFDQDDKLMSTGGSCIGALLRDTFQVLLAAPYDAPVNVVQNDTVLDPQSSVETSSSSAATASSSQSTIPTLAMSSQSKVTGTMGLPQSTVTSMISASQSTVPERYGVKLRREESHAHSILLSSMNDRLSQHLGGRSVIRALDVSESEFHPEDGIAIRTNIQGDDAILHVHTNGSHATAEFRKDASLRMTRRDEVVPKASTYRFSGAAFGIKMQITKGNKANLSLNDVDAYWNAFTYGNGEDIPALKESDSWKFAVCDVSGWMQLAGKVIALERPSDYGYESDDEFIACN